VLTLAYLNPDTGSMLLQALVGGLAGLAVLSRLLWTRVLVGLKLRSPVPMEIAAGDAAAMPEDRAGQLDAGNGSHRG
jgi:hypothetical protein